MLIQMDGSYHPWLGDQAPPFTLLIAVDDATGQVVSALCCEHEDARSYFLLIRALVEHRGVPVALYTDRHAVFKHTPGPGLPAGPTQFSRAMDEMGTQMIFAQSPQAKGRVERTGGTFQDRLVAELRLAGATTLEQAQAVLDEFVPRFNRRFGVPPQCSEPAFRPLDPELCLEQVLCFKHRRKVDRDNTVRFQLRTLQLLPAPERPSYAGATVEVLQGPDGQLKVRHEGRIIAAQEAPLSPVSLRNGHQPDRRQLVLPVTSTIFAGRYGVIIRYGGTVDYRPTNQAIEAETYGRQDTGNGSGQGWDERAFSAQVAEWPIAVAGETGASVAHSAGSLRRGVGG